MKRALVLILILSIPLTAYVPRRILTSVGLAYEKWADSAFPIVWRLNPNKGLNITGSRDMADLVRLGLQAWSSVSTARVSFLEGSATTAANAALDQINLISFAPAGYSSDAAALTILYSFAQTGTDSFGRRIEFPRQVLEADIVFNPNAQFSTDLSPPGNRIDLQSQITHEIGHLLGLDHSGLVSAVMFPALAPGTTQMRTLSADDVSGISAMYPADLFFSLRGGMRGLVRTPTGSPVFGAQVSIVDGSGRAVASALTDPDGVYQVQGLEPGSYSAYAEPLDGPVNAAASPSIGAAYPGRTVVDQFTTRFAAASAPATALNLTKTAGDTQTGNIGEGLATALEVQVTDGSGGPAAGATVTFAGTSGGGTAVPLTAAADAQGKARTTAYLGTGLSQTFTASASTATVTFTAALRAPTLTSVTSNSGVPGTSVNVTLAGNNFVRGATTVTLSATGVTVNSVSVTSPTTLAATFVIDAGASLGNRDVRIVTGAGTSGSVPFVVTNIANISFVDPSSNTTIRELTVNEGNTIQARLRIVDSAGAVRTDVNLSYSSGNPDVASVDSAGNIQGKKAGFSTLTASGAGVVATATITVVQVNAGVAGLETTGVVQDLASRVYLAASQDHTIRLLQSIGQTPEVYAGTPQTPGFINNARLQSSFRNPAFLAVNQADGSLYVSDGANRVIRRVLPGPDGKVETVAGTGALGSQDGPAQSATFSNPQGIALDPVGNLWVVDAGNHTIRRINLVSRTVETIAGLPGAPGSVDGSGSQARFNSPIGIAVEPENLSQQLDRFFRGGSAPPVRVIVADTGNGVIRRVTENGQVETVLTGGVHPAITESKGAKLELTGGVPAQFAAPTGVGVDPFGNIYVTEPAQGQVKAILQSGEVVSAVQANTFSAPKGIAIAQSSRVVIADGAQSVREIRYGQPQITSVTPDRIGNRGGATVVIQGHNFAPDTLVVAAGVLISNVTIANTETISFVAPALDSGRTTVTIQNRGGLAQTSLVIDPVPLSQLTAGTITTIAGGATFIGDGGSALSANLYSPLQMAIDSSGNMFIADYLNNRVRRVDARTGVINTVAGTGIADSGPDGDPAAASPLHFPRSVAVDAAGNIYIGESFRIRKVDARTGILSTVPGSSGGILSYPEGLAFDASGILYIADTYNHRVRKLDLEAATLTTVAGTGQPGFAGDNGPATAAALSRPVGLAFDSARNLYIEDRDNYRIRRVDAATGTITTVAGIGPSGYVAGQVGDNGPATAAILAGPAGITIDSGGNLYIADAGVSRIRKVDAQTGIITTVFGTGQAGSSGDDGPATSATMSPGGLVFDSAGNLYIVESGNNRIRKVEARTQIIRAFAGAGQTTLNGDNGPATAAALNRPFGVALDPAGNIYIAATDDHRIRKVNAQTGIITTVAGTGGNSFSGDNGPATSATLSSPYSLVADATGNNLYIADTNNHRVRRVDMQTGIITTVGGTGDESGSSGPIDVALDSVGNLYIADVSKNRVSKVNLQSGAITIVAGTGQGGFSGDGGPATAAALSGPSSLSLDRDGNLYIADTNNQRIRKVDAKTGIITTVAGAGQTGLLDDGGAATATRLYYPSGVTADSSGNLFIADTSNGRIRKVSAAGIISPVAGPGGRLSVGDNDAATAASLSGPRAVKIDASGNLIIPDTGNKRIRAIRGPVN